MNTPMKRKETQLDLFDQPEPASPLPLELPDRNASRAEVYDYACRRYEGDCHRAESFVRGWFQQSWQVDDRSGGRT